MTPSDSSGDLSEGPDPLVRNHGTKLDHAYKLTVGLQALFEHNVQVFLHRTYQYFLLVSVRNSSSRLPRQLLSVQVSRYKR